MSPDMFCTFSSVFWTRLLTLRSPESFLEAFLFIPNPHTDFKFTSRDVNKMLSLGIRGNRNMLLKLWKLQSAAYGTVPWDKLVCIVGCFLLTWSSALNLNQNSSQTWANSRQGAATLNFCFLTQEPTHDTLKRRRRTRTRNPRPDDRWWFFYSMTPGLLGLMTSNTSNAAAAAVVYFWSWG